MRNVLRRLRGVLGNALVWGVGWFVGILGVALVMYMGGASFLPPFSWEFVLQGAARFGAAGFVAGAGFSAYLTLAHQHSTLLDLRAGRFALGGAVIGVLGGLMSGGMIWGAAFGAVTAGGTLKLAQKAARQISGSPRGALEAG